MIKKSVFIAMLLVVTGFGSAFALQIDSLASGSESVLPPTKVFVNPSGLGDALIYGYYNVRDANRENIFTVINTSTRYGVRARIRFREAADINTEEGLCNGGWEIFLEVARRDTSS
ncbi:MAG TPA: hypothetical protein VEI96_10175 [Thermodesulfovibrionales bacterium]|nr:hypothetical protein [Thermodesulfovibrionales bacterium]